MTGHMKPHQVDIIRRLYPTRTPVEQIADMVGCTYKTVKSRARRMGLKRPKRIFPKTRPTFQKSNIEAFKWPITPWPDDVRFYDHPDALAEPFSETLAKKVGDFGYQIGRQRAARDG